MSCMGMGARWNPGQCRLRADYVTDLTDLAPGVKQADEQTALADVSKYHKDDKVDATPTFAGA